MRNYYFLAFMMFSLSIAVTSCDTDNEPQIIAPTITSSTTSENVEATYTTIKINGNVSSDGGSDITARGVCWSRNSNPTIANDKTIENSNSFTSTIANLTANTTFYVRVYATNSAGTSYGREQAFRTSSLENTTWDFTIIHGTSHPIYTWHADVKFNADGTTVYDEPAHPGVYLTYGTWSLNGNTLSYDLDSSSSNTSYQFTGTLLENTMNGTFTYGATSDKIWSAVKY